MSTISDMVIGFMSGVFGGIAVVYVGQPLDTVKVKMQMFPQLYRNSAQCLAATFRKDGVWRGLYAGSVPALAANVAENAVLFCALPLSQQFVARLTNKSVSSVDDGRTPQRPPLNALEEATAGGLAAFWSTLVLCPTELVKCKQQAEREMLEKRLQTAAQHTHTSAAAAAEEVERMRRKLGPVAICRDVWRSQGVRGFFAGFSATCAREMPGYFFFFGAYDVSKRLLVSLSGGGGVTEANSSPPTTQPGGHATANTTPPPQLGALGTGFCGAIAGMALWTGIFPFDVVKSRVQIESSSSSNANNGGRGGLFRALQTIYMQEGIAALYKGLGPTLLRTIPATAALFITVEYSKSFMNSLF